MTKKITSLILALVMFMTCSAATTISYAADNDHVVDESETVIIDGKTYKYEDSYSDGKKITRIINLTDNTEDDILYYDEENGIVFLNDAPVAYIEDIAPAENAASGYAITSRADNYWRWHDTTNKRITWKQGLAAAALAIIIAGVIPGVGKAAVIAKIGVGVLGAVAAACGGAIVKCAGYDHVLSDGKVQVRLDWTFKPNTGDSYGPYSHYIL